MRGRLYVYVSVLLLVGSVSHSSGQTLLFSVHGVGRQVGGSFGRVLVVVGDVNGDGIPDLAAGQGDVGRVVVFSGADGLRLRTLRSPSPQGGRALVSLWLASGISMAMTCPTWRWGFPGRMCGGRLLW